MGLVIGGTIAILILLAAAGVTVYMVREPGRRVRRKELVVATNTVNEIDDLVDRYHPQLDDVGQAMANEIRQVISKHRKDIATR
jgi:hypothetical protein